MKIRLQLAAVVLLLNVVLPGAGFAFDGSLNPAAYESWRTEIVPESTRTLLTTFSTHYDMAFQKTLNDKHAFFSLYYRDLTTNASSTYLMSEDQRHAEARLVARQALSSAIRETVNDVNLLYTIKEYGRAITSAEMKVRDGSMNFEGPSLSRAGRRDDPLPNEMLRSSLVLIDNADFGLCFRTVFGSVQTNVTYFLAGHDILGASLQRNLSKQSSLILEYRVAPDEQRAMARLQLPFRF
ncbi:MAG: hypothetical protein HY204_02765 [Nitrospirae bacterium]|nr:hypothetical protein [Nitrospirota bacterium]